MSPETDEDGRPLRNGVPVVGGPLASLASLARRKYKGWVHLDTPENKALYLEALARTGQLILAAQAVGCSRDQAWRARKEDDEFNADCEEAIEIYRGTLIAEAHRRAVEGVEKAVIGGPMKNEIVLYERVFSDRLLELMLKRYDHSFRDKVAIEQSGTLQVAHSVDLSKLTRGERDIARVLLGGGDKPDDEP